MYLKRNRTTLRDPLDEDNDTFTDSINDVQEDGDGLEAQIPLQHR